MNVEKHWFENGVIFSKKFFSWILPNNHKTQNKIEKYFTQEYMDNLYYTGLEVQPEDILIFAYASAFLSFLGLLLFDIVVFFSYSINIVFLTITSPKL